jgi:endogenous inhibitor of DNA gyrase (YacG/DUF329 family)
MNSVNKKFLCLQCKSELIEATMFKPFCSKRCQLMDLGSWANEAYKIPGKAAVIEDHENQICNEEQGLEYEE